MARFPITLDSDTTEVRDALEIARTQYVRGDLDDAMKWLRRAADIAFEGGSDHRGLALSKAVADLGPPKLPSPRPAGRATVAPVASRSAAPSVAPSARVQAPAAPSRADAVTAPMRRAATVAPGPSAPAAPPAASGSVRPPAAGMPRGGAAARGAPGPAGPSSARVASGPRGTVPARAPREGNAPLRPRASEPAPAPSAPAWAERPPLGDEPVTDEITAITGVSAGIAAALAFDRAARAASPPSVTAPPATANAPPRARSATRAPAITEIDSVTTRTSTPPPRAEGPAGAAPDPLAEETSPSFPLASVVAVARSRPAPQPLQALRVALGRAAGGGVAARALGPEGLRAGEVEAMVVGVAPGTDLAALFTE